jgi:hypothetical protein
LITKKVSFSLQLFQMKNRKKVNWIFSVASTEAAEKN